MPEDLKRFTILQRADAFVSYDFKLHYYKREKEREEPGMSSTRECSEMESSVLRGMLYSSQRNILLRAALN